MTRTLSRVLPLTAGRSPILARSAHGSSCQARGRLDLGRRRDVAPGVGLDADDVVRPDEALPGLDDVRLAKEGADAVVEHLLDDLGRPCASRPPGARAAGGGSAGL